ncbi:MAG: hypothetical protein ACI9N1_002312 [Flavobacteriales bacterium]|jgi:hypothetical protein
MKFILSFLVFVFMLVSCQSKPEYQMDECKELESVIDGIVATSTSIYKEYRDVYPYNDRSEDFIFTIQKSFNEIDEIMASGNSDKFKKAFIDLDSLLFYYSDSIYYSSDESVMINIDEFDELLEGLEELYYEIDDELCIQLNFLKTRTMELRILTCLYGYRRPNVFNFNKIEPVAFGPPSIKGKVPELKVMFAAYDSTSPMKIRYWIDDSTRNRSNMYVFESAAGSPIMRPDLKKGKHTIYGDVAVQEMGIEKWKNFMYNFEVK